MWRAHSVAELTLKSVLSISKKAPTWFVAATVVMGSISSCGVDTPRLLCHNHEVHFVALCTSIADRLRSVCEASSHPTKPCQTTALHQRPLEIPAERVSAAEQAGGAFVLLALTWLVGILGWLTTRRRLWLAPVLASPAIAGGILWIFRNPTRQPASNGRAVLVPNDGLVRRVAMVQEERFLHGPAMCITIQVSTRNVQVTRALFGGTVRLRRYETGEQSPSDRRCDLAGNQGRRRDTHRHMPGSQPALAARAIPLGAPHPPVARPGGCAAGRPGDRTSEPWRHGRGLRSVHGHDSSPDRPVRGRRRDDPGNPAGCVTAWKANNSHPLEIDCTQAFDGFTEWGYNPICKYLQ